MNETSRYQRHSLIDWFDQDQIKKSKVCVVGAGAIGNEVIKNLILLGVGHIEVFDFDTIEIHNLTRSVLFREEDVGQFKATAACRRGSELDPNVSLKAHNCNFWEVLTPSSIKKFDIVFGCVDNFEARLNLNKLCYLASVNFVNAGIDSRYSSVEIFPFAQTPDSACYECNLPLSVYQRVSERYSCGWLKKVSFVERKIPTTIVTSAISGALAVSLGLKLGSQSDAGNTSQHTLMDTASGRSTSSASEKNAECPCCSQFAPASEILKISRKLNEAELSPPCSDLGECLVVSCQPILVGYYLTNSANPKVLVPVFKKASDFGDDFASTVSSDPDSVLVIVKDQFSSMEFFDQLAGLELPVNFVMLILNGRTTIMEVEPENG